MPWNSVAAAGFAAHVIGKSEHLRCRDDLPSRVGTGGLHPCHAIADLKSAYIRTELADDARAFVAQRQRQRLLVQTAAQLRVEEIDAGGLNLDQ